MEPKFKLGDKIIKAGLDIGTILSRSKEFLVNKDLFNYEKFIKELEDNNSYTIIGIRYRGSSGTIDYNFYEYSLKKNRLNFSNGRDFDEVSVYYNDKDFILVEESINNLMENIVKIYEARDGIKNRSETFKKVVDKDSVDDINLEL